MSARGRFVSVLVAIVTALAGFVAVGALPAAANSALSSTLRWATPMRQDKAAGSFPNCLHSTKGYPELLDSEKRIHLRANATCSGATDLRVWPTRSCQR